jgi:stage V sporulation protein D (sporulation-specific penicillin-binding protein)
VGLTARVVGSGDVVTDQLPAPNAYVAPKSQVIIYAGAEKPTDLVAVPELYGKSFTDAKRALESIGLFIKSGGTLVSSSQAVVSTQSIAKSERVAAGTVIEVTLVDKSILGHY